MARETRSSGSVLIVDADAGIRRLIGTVLEHAGFNTIGVEDFESAATMLESANFAVIVRDLNLAPAERRRSLQQFSATAPELLRRTVVMTTAAARGEAAISTASVFAIVGKPFELDELVEVVRACAHASREADGRAAKRTRPSGSRQSEPGTQASVKLGSLERFVGTVASLQHLLTVPVNSHREAVLRAEMRRTLEALSATLTETAHVEASRTRAAVFRAASTVAARLAAAPIPPASIAAEVRGRDH